MKKYLFILAATAGSMSSQILAGTMGPIVVPATWSWVSSISGGPIWTDSGESKTLFLTPDIVKTYAAKKTNDVLASGEFFLGPQKNFSSDWQAQLGLAIATAGSAKLHGVIWDDADPEFSNYTYRYKVRHKRVAVKGKLLKDYGYWLTPWVSGSLGVGFNRSHNFTNTPLIPEAVPNPNFHNHTKNTFTYTVGAGLQKSITDYLQAGIGYEFADWGKSELGRAYGQTVNNRLDLNHFYTHGLMFNLSLVV
ncbi:Opacity protein and related surface antigens [Legionella beliardensis]|uniref:Opacity protein and related surface antigens n=1 Tax=Legionella beliardensis TaxID=91822 RepID=A0A378I2E5_9GAMM|nr:porin family protein [Legionella beliardensis]STX28871.1 Opacity protein and related surface antigens [Legionella beliardensis]